jgi:hypothetical protein
MMPGDGKGFKSRQCIVTNLRLPDSDTTLQARIKELGIARPESSRHSDTCR